MPQQHVNKNKTEEGFFGRMEKMKDLLLQRKLVWVLYEKFNLDGKYPIRKAFVKYFAKKERGKFLYRSDTAKRYLGRIDYLLGDCIAPPPSVAREYRQEYFIDYDPETRNNMLVTKRGREFLSFGGFIQVAAVKFSKMWFIIGLIITFLAGLKWVNIQDIVKNLINKII